MRRQGFTLIEVLIALAIISIALTAIIKSVGQNIRGTMYLQDKTVAMWVAKDVLTKVQLGLQQLSTDKVVGEEEMLGQRWEWEASVNHTLNKHIEEVEVSVFGIGEKSRLISMTSYKYVG